MSPGRYVSTARAFNGAPAVQNYSVDRRNLMRTEEYVGGNEVPRSVCAAMQLRL